jgi:hypothetical protein
VPLWPTSGTDAAWKTAGTPFGQGIDSAVLIYSTYDQAAASLHPRPMNGMWWPIRAISSRISSTTPGSGEREFMIVVD